MWTYRARVDRVIDGDTIDLNIDLGFDVWLRGRVRVRGINAPERGTPEGQAATAWVTAWLAAAADGVTVTTERAAAREKFGRWLAAITTPGGRDLATDMVAAGHAAPWDGKGARPT